MNDKHESRLLLTPGVLLLVVAFFVPIASMLHLSLVTDDGYGLQHFQRFFQDSYYTMVLWRTIRLSILITLLCTVIGFPLAYIMSRVGPTARLWLIAAVILPLMTSVVIRTFGWVVILNRSGPIAELMRSLDLVGRSWSLMGTESAIVIGMVQVLIPFMTLSILSVMSKIDPRLEEAARSMGCNFFQSITRVILPLAVPGILAGSLLVFTLSASSFITPALLGGVRLPVLAGAIYESVTQTRDWNFAAAQSVILFFGVILLLVPYVRWMSKSSGGNT